MVLPLSYFEANLESEKLFYWNELQQKNDCSLPSRSKHCSILFRNYLVVIGGQQHDGRYPEEILMFDLDELIWKEASLTDAPFEAKYGFTACVSSQDEIIIYGGINCNNHNYLDTVEVLSLCDAKDITFNKEKIHFNLSDLKRAYHTAQIFEGKMYVFAGQSSPQNEDNYLYAFDLKTKSMLRCNSSGESPNARSQHSSALYNGKLYIYGGYYTVKGSWGYYETYLDDLWGLDITSLSWQRLQISNIESGIRKGACMQAVDNKIFIFGGSDGKAHYNSIFCYNIEFGTGEIIGAGGRVPSPRTFHSSALYKNAMTIFGGNLCDSSVYSIKLCDKNIIALKEEEEEEEKKDDSDSLRKDFKKFFLERPFPDIIFTVNQQEIPAHKGILSIRCPYFGNLFTSQMIQGKNLTKWDIPAMKPEVFAALLEYVYCNEIQIMTEEIAVELLKASNEYLLPTLKTLCETFLTKNLSIDNVIQYAILADMHAAQRLKERVVKWIGNHGDIVYQKPDFEKIPKSFLNKIL